jgi:hypothetical protein
MTLTIVHLLPELLGTYGDRGNVEILSWRLSQRNIPHEVLTIGVADEIPQTADLYLLGGGEDDAQIAAREILDRHGVMRKAINRGAHIFAVCAGFQLLGSIFPASGDREMPGLGILPIETLPGSPRSVGELLAEPTIPIGTLTGFENHAGQTRFLEEAQPLGRVFRGIGNGLGSSEDGIVTYQVTATYMHGPALARNPDLADWILERKLGVLDPISAPIFDVLHDERVKASK